MGSISEKGARKVCAQISFIAEDMWAGLQRRNAGCDETSFMKAALLYEEVKYGLRDGTMDQDLVPDEVFFLLKKCIFHWNEGVRLAMRLGRAPGLPGPEESAGWCARSLRRRIEDGPAERDGDYPAYVTGEILKQYAVPENAPSDEWCAWLELEAAKTALRISERMAKRGEQ